MTQQTSRLQKLEGSNGITGGSIVGGSSPEKSLRINFSLLESCCWELTWCHREWCILAW